MEPMILLQLIIILPSKCSLNFNLVSKVKARCLPPSDILGWDLMKESGLGLLLTILREKKTSIACFWSPC